MNVLFLTKYDILPASSRLRTFQYQSKIDASRFNVDVQALLSNNYLEKKFNNQRISFIYLIYLFFKRTLLYKADFLNLRILFILADE